MPSLDHIFHALSDPTRRALLARLAESEATVDELVRPFDISQPSMSRHLKVLEEARLISTRIDGTARPRRIEAEAFGAISDWLEQYRSVWEANYARLDDLLEELKNTEQEP